MDWYQTIFELIDMRSFSNLWFWIALAVMWSTAAHWVIGVPYDLVLRARRQGGEVQRDLETVARINADRLIYIADVSGLWILSFGSFTLTILALLAFVYDVEFAQAVFLLTLPMAIVGLLSLRTARRIRAGEGEAEALHRRLFRHRIATQVVGMISIFVTAMWGMYQNLNLGALG